MNTIHPWFKTQTPNPNNHTKPNIASHSSNIFKHSDHTQALVFRGLSPHNNI